MDVQERLEELAVLIEDAKAMPLSASCLVNRMQVLDLIDEIRHLLPESVQRADRLLSDREAVLAEGRREAERLMSRARAEAQRMVSEHEVYLAAVAEAQALRAEVLQETSAMRRETDDYVDAKLASFEIVLHKTLRSVDRGRERLRGQMYDELSEQEGEPLTEEIFLDVRGDDRGDVDVMRQDSYRADSYRSDDYRGDSVLSDVSRDDPDWDGPRRQSRVSEEPNRRRGRRR